MQRNRYWESDAVNKYFRPIAVLAAGLALTIFASVVQAGDVETGLVKVGDANIEYFSRGKGDAIVLLPGGSLTVGYLDGVADALAKSGYRVVGINPRGSGKSTGPMKGLTFEMMANDVAGVIRGLHIQPAHIAGNDYGNRVARMVAASHPELARSVILLAAGGKVQPKPPAMHALEVFFNPKSTEADILAIMPYFVSKPSDSARILAILQPSRAPDIGPSQMAAAKEVPLSAWWAPPGDTKYLIVQGAEDQIAPPENGVVLQKDLVGRATLITVAGAGHFLPLEQPETTAKHMVDFIKTVSTKP